MSKKVGKRLRAIRYHQRIAAEMRKRRETEYGLESPSALFGPANPSLYDVTTHDQRIKLDEIIEEITGKNCDIGVDDLTDEQLIEILEQALKYLAKKRGKELEKEIEAMIS